ncbi:uncharacterized protein BHQ10_005105 [Talaromyces amestolkiae]|uniref:GATA-type domain-containing protein n=1 Tax=Talaromyces amestolkiae TaxID=1196081 RepID=A0A364KZV4_TALAM|nr:uncharacterized protein BHQ10_005105 [Talaromyces amestolkiae]RAO69093.1 hypothetical protein BHQ10_005105 [Talaromyces amestolkiae]
MASVTVSYAVSDGLHDDSTLATIPVLQVEQVSSDDSPYVERDSSDPPEADPSADVAESGLIDDIEDLFLVRYTQEGLVFDDVDEPRGDGIVEDEMVGDRQSVESFRVLVDPSEAHTTIQVSSYGRLNSQGQPFSHTMRSMLESLIAWGPGCDGGPNTGAFLALLSEVESDTDRVLNTYLQAIPRPVQALFEGKHWSVDDLVCLPDARAVSSRGVYMHLFRREYQGELRVMGYVGYSQCIADRIEAHEEIVAEAKSKGRLPEVHRPSRHYQHALHAVDAPCYKTLATFDDSLETKYLILMESLFMILFRTVRFPGYATRWNPRTLYDSLYGLSKSLGIASPLFGLNMALSVYQGMPHPWSHLDLPCVSCQEMTYPSHHLPRGEKTTRRPFDSKDPRRGYLCNSCRSFRNSKRRLPTPEEIEQMRLRAAHLATGAIHDSCQVCGDLFSEIVMESEGYIHRRYMNGKWCCHPCSRFSQDKGRFPTSEELDGRRRRREAPDVTSCEVCNCDLRGARYKRSKDGKWCCDACGTFFRTHGRFKTAEELENQRVQQAMRAVSACQSCHIPFVELRGPRYNIEGRRCCIVCYDFHRKWKRFRNQKEIVQRQRLHAKKRDRCPSA